MAGVTDRPFRLLCRQLGAGMVTGEMVSANPALRRSSKTLRRLDHSGEASPRSVQIAGADPDLMADAARYNVDHGAEIIDINMGCPAKKVCNKMAGSALLRDERLVKLILERVVHAVEVPVTLKIRTGWDPQHRNGVRIARIAEACGIVALAVHGRTRACGYRGDAEYQTIRAIKRSVSIPVIANGDITGPDKAARILRETGADAVMIGRAAQGYPWIFREIAYYLRTGKRRRLPALSELGAVLSYHVTKLYEFYGESQGVRIARKHVGWYLRDRPNAIPFRQRFNRVGSATLQNELIKSYFTELPLGG